MLSKSITFIDDYYSADEISHGRLVKKFFKDLLKNYAAQNDKYNEIYSELFRDENDRLHNAPIPIVLTEKLQYSQIAVAINSITPIHLSENPFNKETSNVNTRFVDFWCFVKNTESGKALNYFIEIKTTYYCMDADTSDIEFTKMTEFQLKALEEQVSDVKNIRPKWGDDGNVYMGIIFIQNYKKSKNNKNSEYTPNDVLNQIHGAIDKRRKFQILFADIKLPEGMRPQWETEDVVSVSVAALVSSW